MKWRIYLVTVFVALLIVVWFQYSHLKKNVSQISEASSYSSLSLSEPPTDSSVLTESYNNKTYDFSFRYPNGFTVSLVNDPENNQDIVVLQSVSSSKPGIPLGFQISIQTIDEDIPAVTVEMIKRDLPDLVINSPQDVVIGNRGKGVAFISDDSAFGGVSREVWFVYRKRLYQISTYASNDSLVQSVLKTWQFGK